MTEQSPEQSLSQQPQPLWRKVFLVLLAGYLVLLGIGVAAEMFDIEPVLDWWLWRPPGK